MITIAQLACVLSGGRLVQHQNNPSYIHDIETSTGETISITSTHHQAQFPYNLPEDEYELLAWTDGMLPFHLDGENREMNNGKYKEAEIVYYKKTKALGIQGHPEGMRETTYPETFKYLKTLIQTLIK